MLRNVHASTATLTALVERIGYEAAEQVAHQAAAAAGDPTQSIRRLVVERGLLSGEEFDELTSPERVTQLGSMGRRPPDE